MRNEKRASRLAAFLAASFAPLACAASSILTLGKFAPIIRWVVSGIIGGGWRAPSGDALCSWETAVLLRSIRVPLSAQTEFSIYSWLMGI